MNDVVSERLCILLAKRSRTRRFNLATREPPPKDIVLAARVYADNGPHLVVVGRDCHPRSPHDIENSEIAGVVDFLYSGALRLAYPFENGPRVRNCASDNLANGFVRCILNKRGTAVGDKMVQVKHRLDPSVCMDCRVCPWRTLPCPVMSRPPEFLQPLAQGRNACLSVRIVRSQHYYGEAPHTLGLLRARRERPRGRRAAEHDDELAPSYVEHGATSPALDRRHPTMTTRRPTAHAVGLLHAESTMEDGVESLGADLKCSESSPDRYCPAVVSLKVRIEPSAATVPSNR